MASPAEGLARLRTAAESGELDAFCHRYQVRVLTVFGSAARGEPSARDLDIGIITEFGARFDPFLAVVDLIELTGTDQIDLVHLNRGGPVIRERALAGSIGLFESEPAALANAQMAAITERMETDPMRWRNLELLVE